MSGKLRCMASIYLSKNNRMLLLYRQGGRVVDNVWVGSAGGHFEKEELNDAEACVLRELKEELGITIDEICNFSLKYITMRRTKGEIRQNYYFFAELKEDTDTDMVSDEGVCKWFDYSELISLEMPFSAKHMMQHYLETGMYQDRLYVGVADGEKVVFADMPEC